MTSNLTRAVLERWFRRGRSLHQLRFDDKKYLYDARIWDDYVELYGPAPELTQNEFLEFIPKSPLFCPYIDPSIFNDEEAKSRRRYPDPQYDRYIDLVTKLVPLPLPSQLLEQYYQENPDGVPRKVTPLPEGGLPQASTIWDFKDTPGGLAYTDWVKGDSLMKLPLKIRLEIYEVCVFPVLAVAS